jgi:hypothetical protein
VPAYRGATLRVRCAHLVGRARRPHADVGEHGTAAIVAWAHRAQRGKRCVVWAVADAGGIAPRSASVRKSLGQTGPSSRLFGL